MRYLFEKKDEKSPAGSNFLSAFDSYDESLYYDIKFPQSPSTPEAFAIRATMRGLYGKVDTHGYSIMPRREYISQVVTEEGTHNALYIVKECFEEMSNYYSQLAAQNKLNINSVTLKEIKLAKSWVDPSLAYAAHHKKLLNEFDSKKNPDLPEIKDYKTYESSFMGYLLTHTAPITMSGFCASRYADPLQTGLVLDIDSEDFSEDRVKYEGYIKDPNFMVYRKVANRFGFRIDKHIPWRLYFDLKNVYSRRKMAKFGVDNLENFFEKFYQRVVDVELDQMASFLATSYREYYEQNPSYFISKYCREGGTKYEEIGRLPTTLEKLDREYNSNHWIRAYIYFRSVENKKKWKQSKFERVVREATAIYTYRGKQQAYFYIESHFLDKTKELFEERDLTKENFSDRIITDFRF